MEMYITSDPLQYLATFPPLQENLPVILKTLGILSALLCVPVSYLWNKSLKEILTEYVLCVAIMLRTLPLSLVLCNCMSAKPHAKSVYSVSLSYA